MKLKKTTYFSRRNRSYAFNFIYFYLYNNFDKEFLNEKQKEILSGLLIF